MSREMSEESSESILEQKMMKILEEELSALNLSRFSKRKSECFQENIPDRGKKVEKFNDGETSIAKDNTAVGIFQNIDRNELENSNGEDFDCSTSSLYEVVDEMLENVSQQSESECNGKKEGFNPRISFSTSVVSQKDEKQFENSKSGEDNFNGNRKEDNHRSHYEELNGIHKKNVHLEDEYKSLQAYNEDGYQNCEDDFIPPPQDIAEKILQQCEFYFQDFNILKNSYLLNNVRRNKEGYVSVKLLSSFRKIKNIAKHWKEVAYSLENSEMLALNPEKNKVRRIEAVPKIEDTSYGKTVMVFNLPPQNASREYLIELFRKFGAVVSADVFESPGRHVYHKRCIHFHREIASKTYGIIEFEKYENVVNCFRDDEGYLPKENEMVVVPLMPQIFKSQRRNLRFLRNYFPNTRRGYGRGPRNMHRTRNEGNEYRKRNERDEYKARNESDEYRPRKDRNEYRTRNEVEHKTRNEGSASRTRNEEGDHRIRNEARDYRATVYGNDYRARKDGNDYRMRNRGRCDYEMPIPRDGKLNNSGYHFQRAGIRRSYRGRRPFVHPGSAKNYSEGQTAGGYNGMRGDKWQESRQLKTNNSQNINSLYTNGYRQEPGKAYVEVPAEH